jgi:DNA-binding IclR family transcriptional regulator
VLRHLADVTGHTSYLASFSEARLLIVDLAEGSRSPWLEDLQVGLEAAAHATALGKALLATLNGRARRCILAEQGMRPFTRYTPVEPAQVECELTRLRPGDLVMEYGQFREEVCCAGVAIRGPGRDGWWALGASARGLRLPAPLLAELRLAAADLAGGERDGRLAVRLSIGPGGGSACGRGACGLAGAGRAGADADGDRRRFAACHLHAG